MARIYSLGSAKRPHGHKLSGAQLVAKAQRVFKLNDTHGWGRSGYPQNVKKSIALFGNISPKVYVYTKLESEKDWKMA